MACAGRLWMQGLPMGIFDVDDTRPALSVVIPAFNEESRIHVTLMDAVQEFRSRFAGCWELIVVDDGSGDQTSAVVREFAAQCPELILISHQTNQGKGAAVRTGVLASRGNMVLFADADNATPFVEFDPLNKAAHEGAAIACGSRYGIAPGQVRRSGVRRLMASLFSALARWIVRPGVSDTQCGFKLFQGGTARSLFQDSFETGYLFDLEILGTASHRGLVVAEVPVKWREVSGSRVRLFRDSWKMFCGLFHVRSRMRQRVALSSAQPLSRETGVGEQPQLDARSPSDLNRLNPAAGGVRSISAGASH